VPELPRITADPKLRFALPGLALSFSLKEVLHYNANLLSWI
jgi:hypothetical protein